MKASLVLVFNINILANITLMGKIPKKISSKSETNKIHYELVLNALWRSARSYNSGIPILQWLFHMMLTWQRTSCLFQWSLELEFMYFAGKLVYLIVLASVQLTVKRASYLSFARKSHCFCYCHEKMFINKDFNEWFQLYLLGPCKMQVPYSDRSSSVRLCVRPVRKKWFSPFYST